MDLAGKRIIVTGCGRGMGEATLVAYAQAGAKVVGMDVDAETGAAAVAKANEQADQQVAFMTVDVADGDNVATKFANAAKHLGGLDCLAHPAAIQRSSDAGTVSVEDWDLMFAVNVRGTMLTNQAAFQHMRDSGGGAIINFGSISGQRPEPSAAAYSAAKGAVHSWTRTAAGTWGEHGVRVNAILPAMATPMYREAMARADEAQLEAAYWLNRRSIALGQEYGDPAKDLAPVMIFLASDASRFITGQLIAVDGGQTNVR